MWWNISSLSIWKQAIRYLSWILAKKNAFQRRICKVQFVSEFCAVLKCSLFSSFSLFPVKPRRVQYVFLPRFSTIFHEKESEISLLHKNSISCWNRKPCDCEQKPLKHQGAISSWFLVDKDLVYLKLEITSCLGGASLFNGRVKVCSLATNFTNFIFINSRW